VAEVQMGEVIQVPEFRWNLPIQCIIRKVNRPKESEIANTRWYLTMEAS